MVWNSRYLQLFPFLAPMLKAGVMFSDLLEHVADNAPLLLDETTRRHWMKWRLERHRGGLEPFEQEMGGDGLCYQATDKRTSKDETVTIVSDVHGAPQTTNGCCSIQRKWRRRPTAPKVLSSPI